MNYIREKTMADIYYDPAELDKFEIPKRSGSCEMDREEQCLVIGKDR
jgi:hypothetical protein